MKGKELIRRILEVDPDGECEVNVDGHDILAVDIQPGYYDGCYEVLDRPNEYFPPSGSIRSEGNKVSIQTLSIRSLLKERPDAPVTFDGEYAERWNAERVDEWRKEGRDLQFKTEYWVFTTWLRKVTGLTEESEIDQLGLPYFADHYGYNAPMPEDIRKRREPHESGGKVYESIPSWMDRRGLQFDREIGFVLDGEGKVVSLVPREPQPPVFLWFLEDMTRGDSACVPLAVVYGGQLEWAPGEPKTRGSVTDELLQGLPQYVRLYGTEVFRSGRSNVRVGEPWLQDPDELEEATATTED